MECRACGTIDAGALQALTDMLTGMAGLPGDPICHHIIALRSPTAGPSETAIALRLLHELPVSEFPAPEATHEKAQVLLRIPPAAGGCKLSYVRVRCCNSA